MHAHEEEVGKVAFDGGAVDVIEQVGDLIEEGGSEEPDEAALAGDAVEEDGDFLVVGGDVADGFLVGGQVVGEGAFGVGADGVEVGDEVVIEDGFELAGEVLAFGAFGVGVKVLGGEDEVAGLGGAEKTEDGAVWGVAAERVGVGVFGGGGAGEGGEGDLGVKRGDGQRGEAEGERKTFHFMI